MPSQDSHEGSWGSESTTTAHASRRKGTVTGQETHNRGGQDRPVPPKRSVQLFHLTEASLGCNRRVSADIHIEQTTTTLLDRDKHVEGWPAHTPRRIETEIQGKSSTRPLPDV